MSEYTKLGQVAAAMMEALEEDGAEIEDVVIVVGCKLPNGEREVRFRSGDGTGPVRVLQMSLGVAQTIAHGP